MSDKFVYEAHFINDEIIVNEYRIISEDSEQVKTLSSEGHTRYFPNDFFKVAFSKEDAISFLINGYVDIVKRLEDKIKDRENDIKLLKQMVQNKLYEQHVVQVRAKRW